jgi:hypothetical protein
MNKRSLATAGREAEKAVPRALVRHYRQEPAGQHSCCPASVWAESLGEAGRAGDLARSGLGQAKFGDRDAAVALRNKRAVAQLLATGVEMSAARIGGVST